MRWGLTIPLAGVPLVEHADIVRALPDLGYTDLWSSEVNATDAFTPIALASVWEPTLRLGTAIVPTYTRGPALLAMSASTMASAAPGRFVLGIGSSSPAIVHDWNGIEFVEPFRKTRDALRFVRQAMSGERVEGDFDTFTIHRFKLGDPPAVPPKIFLAALRAQMLGLAGREADGALLNWLAPSDVAQCRAAIANPDTEVAARIFVCPTDDFDYVRSLARIMITSYLTVPAYAAFQDWLGRGEILRPMATAWAAGDRKGAGAAVPDAVIDELFVHGRPEACRDQLMEYVSAGIDTPIIATFMPPDIGTDRASLMSVLTALGPSL